MGKNVPNNQQKTPRARNGNVLLFARNFFRHPRMLGSIVPSSRFLIKQLLEPINWGRARVIVEYGPGVGGITQEILRRMRPDGALIAIEMNPDFVSYLRSAIGDRRQTQPAGRRIICATAEAGNSAAHGHKRLC